MAKPRLKPKLQICLDGFQIENYQFDALQMRELQLHAQFYDQVKRRMPEVTELVYGQLMSVCRDTGLPETFFSKFMNIQFVSCFGSVEDPNHLIFFLANCKNLKRLCLRRPFVDQAFYEKLGQLNCPLVQLILEGEDVKVERDYDFLLKFDLLSSLSSTDRLPVDLVLTAFACNGSPGLRFFKQLSFAGDQHPISV